MSEDQDAVVKSDEDTEDEDVEAHRLATIEGSDDADDDVQAHSVRMRNKI